MQQEYLWLFIEHPGDVSLLIVERKKSVIVKHYNCHFLQKNENHFIYSQ